MRLIDADALLKGKDDHQMISTHLIWNAPTVDAVPASDIDPAKCGWLKCGHWNQVSREYAAGEGAEMYAQCSVCGTIELVYTRAYAKRWKYCPYCGAMMDDLPRSAKCEEKKCD